MAEGAFQRAKLEAHAAVVRRGKVQFRLDPENMERLLQAADAQGLGFGVLARKWVVEKLHESTDLLSRSDIQTMIDASVTEKLHALIPELLGRTSQAKKAGVAESTQKYLSGVSRKARTGGSQPPGKR